MPPEERQPSSSPGGGAPARVCVIGAGPSGLVAARELSKEGHSVVVMEQKGDIGGQWLYDPDVAAGDEDPTINSGDGGVHSSIYASLRIFSPREIMGFTDFPFVARKGRDTRRFPGHKELLLYLLDFCDWFGLREMIRFETMAVYVAALAAGAGEEDAAGEASKQLQPAGGGFKWMVRSKNIARGEVAEEVFDAVVVANGHYSHPRLPDIRGMDEWKRKKIHSHFYRVPELFRDEVVVVVGGSISGQDISMELAGVAEQVHLSVKSVADVSQGLSSAISRRQNLNLRPQIERLHGEDGRVLFVDGSWVVADSIVFCTGYSYSFPFLDTKGMIVVDDDRVVPLYEHTFPPFLAPSLSFVGIPRKLIGFPFFESQARWIAQLLSGKRRLPSPEEMMSSVEEFYRSRDAAGIPKRNTHDICSFEYCDMYGDNCDFPHLEEWKKGLCLAALRSSLTRLEDYRDEYFDDDELIQEALRSPHFTQLDGLYDDIISAL